MQALDLSTTALSFLSKREATGEGGLLTGTDPSAFTVEDPLRLWIIQVGIIIVTAQLLTLALRRLRQPKVIAEVLGGILLGPTAFGRIPGFTKHIFPAESLPYLSLVANIGLCLFLFIVGLEIDTSIIRRNARMSVLVSLAGIALPFGLGSILSIPIYRRYVDPAVHFTYFMLFTGVAYSITAFAILCRVLTELRLLDTHVGIIALSAGVGNDIIGWVLFALSVALVNAGSGLTALWILVVCVTFITFLLMPVRWFMHWLAHKTGSMDNGPSIFYMTVVIILVWICAFFTDSIGVNAIFGGFIAGLAVPREGGLAIALTEKLEDMVSIVFLPLYFTLSGLNTNLGLLDDGITWAFTIAIICVTLFGKLAGGTLASRLGGYGWREATAIGALMNCKGLVELIVLNVGLQAGVLSQRVFSMFILEALTVTFITTPLVTALYPPERRVRVGATPAPLKGGENGQHNEKESIITDEQPWRHRFTIVLDKLDHIPSAMALTQLVLPPRAPASDVVSTSTMLDSIDKLKIPCVSVEALQLIELSDRTSAMMKSSVADSLIHTDPMLGIFRMFGELNRLVVTTSLSVVPYDDFARSVAEHAERHASHLVLLPWVPSTAAGTTTDTHEASSSAPKGTKSDHNPFDILFGSGSKKDKLPSVIHSHFIRGVFSQSKTDVALFFDMAERSGVRPGGTVHLFLPFFGGPDDRLALDFVIQLCLDPQVSATVMRMVKREGVIDEAIHVEEEHLRRPPPVHTNNDKLDIPVPQSATSATPTFGFPDTIYSHQVTQTRLRSETADHIAWSKYASPAYHAEMDTANPPGMRQALARIHFSDTHTPAPVHAAIRHARTLRENGTRLLVVVGRSRRLARESHHVEMKHLLETSRSSIGSVAFENMRKTIGDVGAAMTVAMNGLASAVVVMQAAHVTLE